MPKSCAGSALRRYPGAQSGTCPSGSQPEHTPHRDKQFTSVRGPAELYITHFSLVRESVFLCQFLGLRFSPAHLHCPAIGVAVPLGVMAHGKYDCSQDNQSNTRKTHFFLSQCHLSRRDDEAKQTTPIQLMRMRISRQVERAAGYLARIAAFAFNFLRVIEQKQMHYPALKAWALSLAVIFSLLTCSSSLSGRSNAARRRSCAVRIRSSGVGGRNQQIADVIAERNGFRNLGKVYTNE